MKAQLKAIKKHRRFSEEFKRKLVKDFESGRYSVLQLERLYKVSNSLIYRWIYKYSYFNDKSSRIVEMKNSQTDRMKELEDKVKHLEQILGQKQLYIEYMEKLMEITKDETGVDIKKNFNIKQSTGSGKTRKK